MVTNVAGMIPEKTLLLHTICFDSSEIQNEDRKRRSEAIKRFSMSEGGGSAI